LRGARDGDTWLVQRAVRPPRLMCDDGAERPAYWRVLYCLGELIPFWWAPPDAAPGGVSYRKVTTGEVRRLGLDPVLDYACGLAALLLGGAGPGGRGGGAPLRRAARRLRAGLPGGGHRLRQRPVRRRCAEPLAGGTTGRRGAARRGALRGGGVATAAAGGAGG